MEIGDRVRVSRDTSSWENIGKEGVITAVTNLKQGSSHLLPDGSTTPVSRNDLLLYTVELEDGQTLFDEERGLEVVRVD